MFTKYIKIVVYTPSTHADKIREALAVSGAGHIGNYDNCTFSVKGTGRFRGLEGTKPFIGESGKIEQVDEERIETILPSKKIKEVLEAVKKVHPYEEPAIDIYSLLNE
jgi:hypothetical protein